MTITSIILILANGHILFGYERISLRNNQFDCYIADENHSYISFFRFYDWFIESIFFIIIPFIIMIICSYLIILEVWKTRQSLRYNHIGKFYYSAFCANETIERTVRKTLNEQRTNRLREKDIQLCTMLLGTTLAFLLLCLPMEINDLFLHTARERSCVNWFRKVLFMLMQQIYYAGHFYIYTLTGQLFRKHLYAILFPPRANDQIYTQRFLRKISLPQRPKLSFTSTITHRLPTTFQSNPNYGSCSFNEPSQQLLGTS